MTANSPSPRPGVLHSDGSLTVLSPGATGAEAAAEAAMVSVSEAEPAAAVRVSITDVEYLGPRIGSDKATL